MTRIADYDLNDFKKAFDSFMKKDENDALQGIKYINSWMEDDKHRVVIVKDQCDMYYYVIDKGDGAIVFDYDLENKVIGEETYIATSKNNSRTLIADSIKKFYYDYLEAIK